MVTKYGKESGNVLRYLAPMLAENDALTLGNVKYARAYLTQPPRTECKLCAHTLPPSPDLVKIGVPYAFCTACGHFNGMHDDTLDFARLVHEDEGFYDAYKSIDAAAYQERVKAIYLPKAQFLKDALADAGEAPAGISVTDYGAGAGYFVRALQDVGMPHVAGLELSDVQVRQALDHLPVDAVRLVEEETTINTLGKVNSAVVSMIGVLEHLADPRGALQALRVNPHVRYFYISVPLFSLSVYLEAAFEGMYHRQLSSDHTHLFTNQSLRWMAQHYGMTVVGEWWFGADCLDYFRLMKTAFIESGQPPALLARWDALMVPLIDTFQGVLDSRQLSSEVHLVFKMER